MKKMWIYLDLAIKNMKKMWIYLDLAIKNMKKWWISVDLAIKNGDFLFNSHYINIWEKWLIFHSVFIFLGQYPPRSRPWLKLSKLWASSSIPSWPINIPICSMFSIFTYIWVIYGVNVGKYSIHGAYGIDPGSRAWKISTINGSMVLVYILTLGVYWW